MSSVQKSARRLRARHLAHSSFGVLALLLSAPHMAQAADKVISSSQGPQTWTEYNFTIAPSGTVTGGASSGVQVDHPDSGGTFINQGTLSYSNLTGIKNGSASSGLDIAPTSFIDVLRNEGLIVSTESNYAVGIFNANDGYIGTIDNRGDINAQFVGIANYASIGTLRNSGTIGGATAYGYQQTDGDWANTDLIDNSGTINGHIAAISAIGTVGSIINRTGGIITSPQYGMILAGEAGSIDNQGSISGGAVGIALGSLGGFGNFGALTNSGSIQGHDAAIYLADNYTIDAIRNGGVITGLSYAISSAGSIGLIDNSGTIFGSGNAILFGAHTSTITNSGYIIGGIYNNTTEVLTINGGASTRGTLTGVNGAPSFIWGNSANVNFDSGLLLLNDHIMFFAGQAAVFSGANVQVNNGINVTGDIVLSAGEMVFGVTSPTTYGHYVVTGDAALDAGRVSLVALGAPSFAIGQTYHVLSADAVSAGSVTTSVKGYKSSYDIVDMGGSYDFVVSIDGIDQTSNQLGLTAQQLALNSLSPVIDAVASHRPKDAASLGSGVAAGSPAAPSALWGKVLVASSSFDSSPTAAGYSGNSSGLIVGYDMDLPDNVNAGLALSWLASKGDADDQIDGTDVDADTYALTAYGSWAATDRWQFGGQISYGLNRVDQRRGVSALPAVATADYDGAQITGEVRGGYTLPLSVTTSLTPYAAFRGTYVSLDHYTEQGAGAFNLAVNSISATALRHDIGVKLATRIDTESGKLTPALRVGWLHDYKDTALSVSGITGGTGFISTSDRIAQDGLGIGFTADLTANDSVTVGLEYGGEFRSDYMSNTGALKLAIRF